MLKQYAWIAALILTVCAVVWQPIATQAAAHHRHGGMMTGKMGGMGMGMGMMMTPQAKHLRHTLDGAKGSAAKKGMYNCCIGPSCDWCISHMGACTCYKGVASGMGTCRECHGGWEAGQGRVPGKTKEDVRGMKTIGI